MKRNAWIIACGLVILFMVSLFLGYKTGADMALRDNRADAIESDF